MDTKNILKQINGAVKDITTPTTMGDALLNPEQFDRFVREMQDEAIILNEARYHEMDAQKSNIDRIAFMDRVLEAGGSEKELAEDDYASPNTKQNQLIAHELLAVVALEDTTVRRNIERDSLEDTIVTLLGEAAGRDMEEYSIFASEDFDSDLYNDGEGWSAIDMTDAWVKTAANKLWEGAFDDTADGWPEDLFQEMLESLPKKYLQNRGDWRFYVPWELEDAYRDLLKDRGTQLGDETQAQYPPIAYKGIPVVYAPMLERYDARTTMLQNPDNMVWGVFHDVTLETEREAKKRRTDFVLNFEGDAKYEDENAAVVAVDADNTDDAENGETGEHPLA